MKPNYVELISKAIKENEVGLARSLHALFSASATSKEDHHDVHELGNKIQILNQFFDLPPEV